MDEKVTAHKDMGFLTAIIAIIAVIAIADLLTGCHHPAKLRDVGVKGMYVNGATETVAIGSGRVTSIPGEREALAAHYEEDTAWLQPSIKTHKVDVFLVGTNSVTKADEIIKSICQAFADLGPSVSKNNATVAKGGTSALDVIKNAGEIRKAIDLAKAASDDHKHEWHFNAPAADAGKAGVSPASDCPDCDAGKAGVSPASDCPDCEDK